MNAGSFCTRDVATCDPDTTILDTARLMRERHVGDLVVIDRTNGGARPMGVLTDRDLVLAVIAAEADPGALFAADVMSEPLVTAHEGDDLWQLARRMRLNGVRRMPVIDAQGNLVGLVALDDLLTAFSWCFAELAHITGRQHHFEEKNRA